MVALLRNQGLGSEALPGTSMRTSEDLIQLILDDDDDEDGSLYGKKGSSDFWAEYVCFIYNDSFLPLLRQKKGRPSIHVQTGSGTVYAKFRGSLVRCRVPR